MLLEISKTQNLPREVGNGFLFEKAKHMCTQVRYDFFLGSILHVI